MDVFVEVSPAETRIAYVTEKTGTARVEIHRDFGSQSMQHAIWRGRVMRVEKAMKAAFIDLGPAGEALLPKAVDGKGRPITEGQWMVVQVSRDPHRDKGLACQSRPTLVDRYLSFQPFGSGVTYDRALGQGRARSQAEAAVDLIGLGDAPDGQKKTGGWMVRPAIAGLLDDPEEARTALQDASERLLARWQVVQDANDGPKPRELEPSPGLLERLIRDVPADAALTVDDRIVTSHLADLAAVAAPDLAAQVTYSNASRPLFEMAGVSDDLDDALARRVALVGGGEIVFDEAEAMVVVDVNIGSGAAANTQSDAAVRLNQRAAREIGRQIVLRNLAGLIVIDFVRMRGRGDSKRVIDVLRQSIGEATKAGGAMGAVDILGMTAAGLVEITRQRSGPSLSEMLMAPIKTEKAMSDASLACEVLRRALYLRGGGQPTVYAPEKVLALLNGPLKDALDETATRLGQPLRQVARPGKKVEIAMERE